MSGSMRRSRWSARRWAVSLWFVFIVLFFFWQSVSYRGLVALAAEWQFNEFGIYRPALTYLLLISVLAPLPMLLTRSRKRKVDMESEAPVASDLSAALRSANRFMKVLFAVAGAAFGGAVLCLIAMWLLPSDAGRMQRITASDTIPAEPKQGLTELSGKVLYNRTSAFDQNFWLIRRNTRFAPMIDEGSDETAIRYFVELAPGDKIGNAGISVRRGILKRDALPGELLQLYSYAGFRVLPEHYVLFSTAAPMRWPYLVMAFELVGCGMVVLLVGGVQWRRRRRLAAAVAQLNE